MSSIANPQPEMPAAEELVAYLDGELPPDDCRRVEQRLAADSDYRQQLRDLDQAWEALDVLPTPKTGDDFARTTMELVTVAAQADVTAVTANAANARRRRMGWYAAAAIAGALIGFAAVLVLLPNRNQALLRDLPVIRQADALRLVENVEFLQRLAVEVPPERLMNDEAAVDNELAQLEKAGAESLETRRQWVEELSPDDKVILAAQAKRFYDLKPSPDEQDRLRALERDVSSAGPDVQRTLLAYGQWLAGLTAGKQDELRQELQDRSVAEQVRFVQELVEQERRQMTRRLTPEDAERLRNVLRLIVSERQAELLRNRRRGDDRWRRDEPRGALMILARELKSRDGNNQIWKRLVSQLSPEASAHLESLPAWRRPGQLWKWIGESLQAKKVNAEELERFFAEKLDNEQREWLLSLQADEMQAQLERLYYVELGYGDAAKWWSELRERGDGMRDRPRQDGRRFGPDGPDGRHRPDRSPDGPPPGFNDRGRIPPGPGGPRPQDDQSPADRRPPGGPGPRPQAPPPDEPPPRDEELRETI
ncbi:MAG: hypothetical protein L0228_07870 [Planctomycetes bacterium]|nr:hypothetical protein [Planctomycetota bacterium]